MGKFLGMISKIAPDALVRIGQYELNNAGVTHIANLSIEVDLHTDNEFATQIRIHCSLCDADPRRIWPALRFD
jgi:hypothetical protein